MWAGDGALLTTASRSAIAEGSGESLLEGNRSTSGGQVVWEEISSMSEVVDSCGVLSLGVGIGGYFQVREDIGAERAEAEAEAGIQRRRGMRELGKNQEDGMDWTNHRKGYSAGHAGGRRGIIMSYIADSALGITVYKHTSIEPQHYQHYHHSDYFCSSTAPWIGLTMLSISCPWSGLYIFSPKVS